MRIHYKSTGEHFYDLTFATPATSVRQAVAINEHTFAIPDGKFVKLFESCNLRWPLRYIEHSSTVHALTMCGDYLAAHSHNEHTVKLWDVHSIIKLARSASEKPARIISVPHLVAANKAGDSLTMAVAGHPGFLKVWDLGSK